MNQLTLFWRNKYSIYLALSSVSFSDQIKQLQHDGSSLQSEKTRLDNESKTLRQKVEILTELYQQKEMALQK